MLSRIVAAGANYFKFVWLLNIMISTGDPSIDRRGGRLSEPDQKTIKYPILSYTGDAVIYRVDRIFEYVAQASRRAAE